MAIRYDNKLNNEIKRIVNNYNQKINRLEKKNNPFLIIPNKITKENIENIKLESITRSDLKRRLRELERFTKRGGEKTIILKNGTQLPLFEYQNIKARQALLKRRANKIIKFSKETKYDTGTTKDFTLEQLGTSDYRNALAKKNLAERDISEMTEEEIKLYYNRLIANTKDKDNLFLRNYKDILNHIMNTVDYDKDKQKAINKYIKSLSSSDFIKLYNSNEFFKQIVHAYNSIKDIEIGYLVPSIEERLNDFYFNTIENDYAKKGNENLDEYISSLL